MLRVLPGLFRVLTLVACLATNLRGQVASNSATGLTYASLQAALLAATNNYTVFLMTDTVPAPIALTNRTNLTITTYPTHAIPKKIQSGTLGTGIGLTLTNCVGVTLTNLWIGSWATGVSIDAGCVSNRVQKCQVISNTTDGVRIGFQSTGHTVEGNAFDYPGGAGTEGVWLNGATGSTVRGNTFSNMSYSVALTSATNNTVASNTLYHGAAYGIYGLGSSSENLFLSNAFWGAPGVMSLNLNGGRSNRVISNFLTSATYGIVLNPGTNNTVAWNQVFSNVTTGVEIQGQSIGNLVASNFFLGPGCTQAVNIDGGGTSNLLQSNTIIGHVNGVYIGNGSSTPGNTIFQNRILSNTGRSVWISSASTGNAILENLLSTTNTAIFTVQAMAGCDRTLVYSNTLEGNNYGIVFQNNTSNRVCFNTFLSNDSGVSVQGAPSKGHIFASNTFINLKGTQAILLNLDSFSNLVLSNHILGYRNGITFDAFNYSTNHQIIGNDIEQCAVAAITVQTKSFGTRIIGNRLHGGSNGIVLSNGVTNVFILTNIVDTPGIGVTFISNTNILVVANIISNARIGLFVTAAIANFTATQNLFDNPGANVSNLTAALDLRTNAFGPTNRSFISKRLGSGAPPIIDPWINALPGSNGDFLPPPAPTALAVTNGIPGWVHLGWAAAYPGDFASALVYRTRTTNGYSNLTDGEFLNATNDGAAFSLADHPSNGGFYYYCVTVRDQNGNESSYSPQAAVSYIDPPVPSFTVSPSTSITNLLVSFTSSSTPGTGNITNYKWVFGDGTTTLGAALSNTSHPYASATNTWVTLVLFSDLGQSVSNSNAVTIHAPPTALFTGPPAAATNLAVFFTNTSIPGDAAITNFQWLFGDGTTLYSTNTLVTHMYPSPLTNGVTLIAYDNLGQTNGYTRSLTVNAGPSVSLVAPAFAATNAMVNFAGSALRGTAFVTNFRWDFGDGTILSGSTFSNTNHGYGATGTYTVAFTAMDDLGLSNTTFHTLNVGTWYFLGGLLTGHAYPITLTLSGSHGAVTNSGTNGNEGYGFWVSNGTYTVTPTAVGYGFAPASRTVTISFASFTNGDFVAVALSPVLSFTNLLEGEKVKRVRTIRLDASVPPMFAGRTVTHTISSNGGSLPFISNALPFGTGFDFDTTLLPDGPYTVTATATDIPFGRTQSLTLTLQLDNNLFKVVGKGVSNQRAIVYDTVRSLSRSQPAEIYFFLQRAQPVAVTIYDKRGRVIKSFSNPAYPAGLNLVSWNNIPAGIEAGVYFAVVECEEFKKQLPLVLDPR